MKITVTVNDKVHAAKLPYPHAKYVLVDDLHICPACNQKFTAKLGVAGGSTSIESHDTYRAEAYATCCKGRIGVIRVKMGTIFGLEEDEAVLLNSRCRVY